MEYFIGVSDGTLLKGATEKGFSVEAAGAAQVSISTSVVTIDGPVRWVMLSPEPKYPNVKSTIEFRKDQAAAMLEADPGEEDYPEEKPTNEGAEA